MPKGAFAENVAARNMRFRFDLASTGTRSVGTYEIYLEGWGYILWGVPYAAATNGIKVYFKHRIDIAGAVTHEVTVSTPWGNNSVTGAGWLNPANVLIEIDDAELGIDATCNGWTWDSGDVRFYLNTVLKATWAGPHAHSGVSYDRRNNDVTGQLTPFPSVPVNEDFGGSFPIGKPLCGYSALNRSIIATLTVGAQYWTGSAWSGWDVEYDTALSPPDLGCTCSASLPAFSGTDSWTVVTEARYVDMLTIVTEIGRTCDCPPGYSGTFTVDVDTYTRDFVWTESSCSLKAKDSNITKTRRTTFAVCDAGYPPSGGTTVGPDDTVEAFTIGDLYRSTKNYDAWLKCCRNEGPCTPVPPSPPDNGSCEDCFDPLEEDCYWAGWAKVEHPETPPCLETSTPLSYDVSESNRHLRVVNDAGGSMVSQLSSNGPALAWTDKPSGLTVTAASVRWTRIGGKFILATIEGGAVKLRTSANEGGSFSVATTIDAGPGNTQVCSFVGRSNLRYVYWRNSAGAVKGQLLDAGGNVVQATFTAYAGPVDNSPISADESTIIGASHRVILHISEGGAVKEIYSTDGKTFS